MFVMAVLTVTVWVIVPAAELRAIVLLELTVKVSVITESQPLEATKVSEYVPEALNDCPPK